MNEQMFDKWVQEALATDVTPSDDFTARVMACVAATPQELPRKNTADTRKLKRMMTALAACAAIVILIPMGMLMMPANEKAAADCAASESFVMDDAAADMEYFTDERSNGAVDDVEEQIKEFSDASGSPTEIVVTDSDGAVQGGTEAEAYQTMVHLVGDEAVQARAILAEMGCLCEPMENSEEAYDLTAAETAALCQKLPGVIEVEGPLHLTLEVVR